MLSVALMLGASASFVAMQAVVKHARQSGMDTTEVMFFPAPGLPVLYFVLRRAGHGLRPTEPGDVFVRSLLGSLAMATNFAAMLWLSLAQFSTLHLTQPVLVALASPLVLGERVRRHTWAAMPLAALGAFILIAPGLGSRDFPILPALLALASAAFSCFAQIWVRRATASDPPDRVVFHFAAFVAVVSLVIGVLRGHFQFPGTDVSLLRLSLQVAGMAGFGTLGQALMTRAYFHGEAAPVSMVAYSGIAMSLVADLAFWRVWPAPSALVGALFMVFGGVVLVRGERR
jgi:drug/metabolite transporter (DMT)-like permease